MAWTVDFEPLELEYAHPFGLSRWTMTRTSNLLACFELEGFRGWGEGAPNRRYGQTLESDLDFVLEFQTENGGETDPDTLLENLARSRESGSARCALDLAIFDWIGHRRSEPVYQLVGFPAPAPRSTSFTIGIDAPETMARRAREAAEFAVLKIKVGTRNDEASIRAIRSVSDKPLRVDANEGWNDREEAARRIDWMASMGVELVEQPMPAGRLEDVAWLRERSPLPIFADEDCKTPADLEHLIGVFDGVNVKLDKCGGLLVASQLVKGAREAGLQVMLGCMLASSLSTTAAFHLAGLADCIDLDGHLLLEEDPFEGAYLKEGRLHLPLRNGIGAKRRVSPAA